MKKRKKIVLFSLGIVTAILIPLGLVSQYGKDDKNYMAAYIDSLEPIPTRELRTITYKENVKIINEKDTDFKILQISDVHFVGSRVNRDLDLKTLKAVYALVDHAKPDLVVYTGDIVYPMFYAGNNDNLKATKILNSFFEKMAVPFVYQYGNHDTDFYGTATYMQINEIFQSNKYCYAKEDQAVSIKSGRLSQVLEISNSDSTLNTALFLLDSNTYNNGQSYFSGYANFTDQQVYWYEKKLQNLVKQENVSSNEILSLAFFHIPPYEYKKALELYKKGDSEVEYLGGENHESVSTPNSPSGLFEKIVEYQSTKAMFFGHDHKNSLSLKYKGVEMYYGHAIDYRAYPTIQFTNKYRGAKLITIKPDKSFIVEDQMLKDIIDN